MARIRSVKPGLRTSRVVKQWPWRTRYFWVLLWGYLDDEGRGLDIPKAIAGDCFPLDEEVTAKVVDTMLQVMASTKIEPDREPPVCRYEVAGIRYLHAVNWPEHQKPNRPSPSVIPSCPTHDRLTESFTERFSESFTEPPLSRHVLEGELGGGEGGGGRFSESGSEVPPPRQCPKHLGMSDPPNCVRCREARLEHESWQAAKRARLAASPRCSRHPDQIASNCASCRADRLAGGAA